jgi:hypothetical protein
MGEPYVIRLLVEAGDPDGVRTATRQNWNGKAVAFPRADWPRVQKRPELRKTGVYMLVGPTEGAQDGVPTIYVGRFSPAARLSPHAGPRRSKRSDGVRW